ncbi:hypothetical protein BCV70DRAFT_220822 [Testicularia cyperi]|uniref:BTB domain-containing protein n=1 Tax=Testicularia cyperi TaxID=1882483 RepID=A0A317XLZ1_9BASI|nr:hypothetical protein BCV70DRAFT_220822 [Testicularia cyperi]
MHTGHIAQAQSARNFGSTSNASTLAYHNAQAQLAQHLASDPSLLPSSLPIQHTFEETTTISFTWLVRDLHLLRDEVEHSPPPSEGGRSVSAGAGKSEVWTTQPIFGDGKWKLELQPIGGASITVLSVYLSAMVLDYNHADIEIPASIMLAIRPVRRPIGANGSLHGGWTWRRFYDFTFRREAEFFACHDLPSLSEMLQDAAISRDDSFALTVQLDSSLDMAGARPPFEVDGHRLVPRTVIGSLRGLLDDANSGDVRIVVRERGLLVAPAESIHDMHGESQAGHVVPFPVGSKVSFETGSAQDPDHVFVRDRFLWAHSSILKNRSEYFSTMLTSDFSEGIGETYSTGGAGGRSDTIESGRCVRTLRIPDADFVTTYWFLRYLYTEEIQFADEEDVRSTVLDEDWTREEEQEREREREEQVDALRLGQHELHITSTATSPFGLGGGGGGHDSTPTATSPTVALVRGREAGSGIVAGSGRYGTTASTSGSIRARTSGASLTGGSSMPSSPSAASSSTVTAAHNQYDDAYRSKPQGRSCGVGPVDDPHVHPTREPGKASALSIFRLAHRYHMQDLSRLASLHLISTLTPQTCFPLLLATSMYTELHTRVKTYVYTHWHLVANTQEFERCCDEVSTGMWGSDAGKTLRAFVRSLVSPLRPPGV